MLRQHIRVLTLAVAVGLLIANRSPAGAQQNVTLASRAPASAVFRGRVIRQGDGLPVAAADVWLASVDKHVTTDSTGAFRVDGLPVGLQLVQVRHLGFDVARDTIMLSPEHDNVRTYALAVQAASLDTVRTVAANQKYVSPRLKAFEDRRLSGQGGRFISDSTMRQSENMSLTNLVAGHIPGLMQVFQNLGTALVSTRKACKGLVLLGNNGTTGASSCKPNQPDCYVAIYLDGVLQYSTKFGGTPPDLAKMVSVSNLAGAEFYADAASAPVGMNSDDDGCGSLWLWTRER